MRTRIAATLFPILWPLLSLSEARADINISCPLETARRTITNDLPEGWWTTPYVNRFSEAKVSRIGGRVALLCVYGGSGSVQRYAPAGHVCRPAGRGFRCKRRAPRPERAPGVFKSGNVRLKQTFTLDLDRGRVGGRGTDLWFQAETRDLLYLAPRNGARLSVGDRSKRGHRGCSRARFTDDRVSLRDVPAGSYVCVRTSEGRIGQFRIRRISRGSPKTLLLSYTTWRRFAR